MNALERFGKAMSFEEGPLPLDFGANPVSGIHCSVVEGLREYYGLDKRLVKTACPYQFLGVIEPDLKEAIGIDTDAIWNPYNMFGTKQDNWKEYKTWWGQTVLISGDTVIREGEGGFYAFAQGDASYPPSAYMPDSSYFFDSTHRGSTFDKSKMEWHDNTEEYQPVTQEVLDFYKDAIGKADSSKWIAGNFGGTAIGDVSMVPASMLPEPKGIRDVEEWYAATLLYPEYLHKVFEFQTEVAIENLKKIYEVVGENIQHAFVCGTDFGTQIAPICSPDTYKELHMPYHKKINNWIHENTGWKTFKHSCGAVEPFIESFIEAGFDILNPVQWTATGMDRETLKKKYSKRVVFWGGGVDTQRTLPFGTPEEVTKEVLETCEIMGKNGGFVFNAIHNVQAMTPVENMVAMFKAVKKYNKG